MGDQTNRIEQKIDYIIKLLTPQPKNTKKEIKQKPTPTE